MSGGGLPVGASTGDASREWAGLSKTGGEDGAERDGCQFHGTKKVIIAYECSPHQTWANHLNLQADEAIWLSMPRALKQRSAFEPSDQTDKRGHTKQMTSREPGKLFNKRSVVTLPYLSEKRGLGFITKLKSGKGSRESGGRTIT